MSTSPKRTAIRKSKKCEKPEKIKRAENLFVALVASDTCLTLPSTLTSRPNMVEKYLKEPSEAKTERPRKEEDPKTYVSFYEREKHQF
jgi:hypothetical protein